MITGLYAGILGLALVALILNIALKRMTYKVGLGDGGIPDLHQAIRIHGNFIEMVPVSLLLLMLVEQGGASLPTIHALGMVLLLARALHAYGIYKSPFRSFGRSAGVILNLGMISITSIILICKIFINYL